MSPLPQAEMFLRAPPFPGARPVQLAHDAPVTDLEDAPERLIALLRDTRVGGGFWGGQPEIPAGTVIACPKNRHMAEQMLARARAEALPLLFWVKDAAAARDLPTASPPPLIDALDPWHIASLAHALWGEGDDERLLVARIAGTPVTGFSEEALPDLAEAVAHALLTGKAYTDPFTGQPTSAGKIIGILGHWRALIDANRAIGGAAGMAFWKRETVEPLLWSGGAPIRHIANARELAALPDDASVAIWKSKTASDLLAAIEARADRGVPLHEVEDGFIRSIGLGADCVPPLSITVDPVGVHFDPSRPSLLEQILNRADFPPRMLDRAAQLRALIVETGLSKYGVGRPDDSGTAPWRTEGKRIVLITGQVEDDRSVVAARGPVAGNLDLLRRARAIEPDAFLIYRPHPDVDAGHRIGHIPDATALALADTIDRATPISTLLDQVDGIHVLSSLAGFEALLRGRDVTTHGVPFYAGWGLTRDLGDVPVRRVRKLDLDQLVAGVLLRYPRYLDPVTKLPCTPEILVHRLASGVRRQNRLIVPLRRLQGKMNKWRKRAGSVEKF
jgi:capsular polysaccharide export protein